MRIRAEHIRSELPPLLRLALPLIAGELGWVAMSVVDTVMLGHLPHSALAMASAALAQVLFNVFCFGVGGVLLGLDTFISQAFGARQVAEANRWLLHGLVLAVGLAALLIGVFALAPLLLNRLPVDRAILDGAIPAMRGLNYGTLPLLLYFTLRRYLQAANHGRPIAYALISANLVNAGADWLLIYGHHLRFAGHALAIPAFGVVGSSWSTSFARFYLFAFLLLALRRADRRNAYGLIAGLRHKALRRIEFRNLRRLFLLGAPAGAAIFVEIAIFGFVTAVIATFGPLPLAGHEVALQCASTTFMIPFAISIATTVRVGNALGRVRRAQSGLPTPAATVTHAAAAGWSGICFGAICMLATSILLLTAPSRIARLFSPDPSIIAAAVPLLLIAAGFQFFDGIQITATGALRGAGNTTAPFWIQLVCHWAIGMPLGLYLAFHRKLGAAGLWWGLLLSLAAAATVLLYFWQRTTPTLTARLHLSPAMESTALQGNLG